MPLDPVDTLRELVRIPSVNPMGRAVDGPEFFEHRVTDYLQALFTRLGLPWQRQQVEPRRENIVARLDGTIAPDKGGAVLMLEAHQDTVPVDGMTIDPFAAEERGGRIYGRGACDIKGGMAAMLTAVSRLIEDRPPNLPTIMIVCTVNEEQGFTGAKAITKLWQSTASIFPRKPDAAIVAEPTSLDVVVAHKGCVRWECRIRGRAVHSSRPDLGDNAIYKMARVLRVLERYQREVAPTLGEHRRCGRPSLSVGTITGGISVNTVPDECVIKIDRRLLPDEEPAIAMKHVVEYLAHDTTIDFPVQHDPPFLPSRGLPDLHNTTLGEQVRITAESVSAGRKLIGVPYGTDASTFQNAGVPSIVFGPGSIDQAHTADEWIETNQLHQAAEVLYRFARDFTEAQASPTPNP
jgi:acetylornithine deacetylase/succinyl-diaminopimelate desuccinylase family protein